MRTVTALASLALTATVLASCSSDGDGAIASHLEYLPALDQDRYQALYYTDYDRLADQVGLERPDGDDPAELEEWFTQVVGLSEDAPATAAGHHPRPFRVAYAETLELGPVEGVSIAQIDSFLETVDGDRSWIVDGDEPDTPFDDQASAASDPILLAVAEALDDAGVYAAELVCWGSDVDLHDVGVTGVGLSVEDEEPVLTLVYGHADDEAARDTYERAEDFFDTEGDAELYRLDGIDREGSVVVATFTVTGDRPLSQAWGMSSRFDPVLFAGE